MRARAALIIAAVIAVCAALGAQQAVRDTPARPSKGTAVISGIVTTDERTPQPARKVRVTLNSIDRSVPGRTATTDDAGRFAFLDLPAGRFMLAGSKPGYLTTNFGGKRPDRPGTPIPIADGQRVIVAMTIARGGAITGIVRDQSGQPMPGVAVSVLRYGFSTLTGERTLSTFSSGSSGQTDDRGVYRAWGLPPGDYVVMASASGGGRFGPPGLDDVRRVTPEDVQRALRPSALGAIPPAATGRGAPSSIAPGPPVNYAPVFHPGAADISLAQTISLSIAEERAGVDVQLHLVPTSTVGGTVKTPEGLPPQSVTIGVVPAGPQALLLAGASARTLNARPDRDGTFSVSGVPPGAYTVTARTGVPAGRGGPNTGPVWWAQSDISVDGANLEVALELQPGMTIAGRLIFEGGSTPPADLASMRLFLVPPGSGGNLSAGPPGGQIDAQGRFGYAGVTPGVYWFTFFGGATTTWSLRHSTFNGRDAYDSPIEVKPGENGEWLLTFSDQKTELAGTVSDASGRAASDYFVIVFPVDRGYWTPHSRRVRTTRPATDGKFSIAALPPGDYLIAALVDVEQGEWNDPAFLAKIVSSSIKVTLTEGQKTAQDLRLAGGH